MPNIERQNIVLSVGAILPHKGFDFIIKSLSYIPKVKRPKLMLVGNVETTEERERLQGIAENLNVKMQIDVGISLDVLIRRYNQALVMAYAPYNEPFGLAPLEAMACGTPVVGVAEGGVRETVVDGICGNLVPRDPRKFSDAIMTLLGDDRKREQYGIQAREHIQNNWSWEGSVKHVVGFLQKVGANQR